MQYSRAFKERMVQKMWGPGAMSANALARQEGIAQTTLSRWKREASSLAGMTKQQHRKKSSKSTTGRRPEDWSLEEKLQVLLEASALTDKELGAYLRRKGLHEATLQQWRAQVARALSEAGPRAKKSREHKEAEKRIRKLERELKRKDAALAETAALLVLKKSPGNLGGRGRRHNREERMTILRLVAEAVEAGARQRAACELLGITARTLERWRAQDVGEDRRHGPKTAPGNKPLADTQKRPVRDT